MPEQTPVSELEFHGLTAMALNLLDNLGVVYVEDMTGLHEDDVLAAEGGGPNTLHNIRESLRNWRDRKPTRTVEQVMFPKNRR